MSTGEEIPLALRKSPRGNAGINLNRPETVAVTAKPIRETSVEKKRLQPKDGATDDKESTCSSSPVGDMSVVSTPTMQKRQKVPVEKEASIPGDRTPPLKRRKHSRAANHMDDDKNDCYCWLCHKEGSVICCEICPRVYHLKCLNIDSEVHGDWTCPECQRIMQAECVDTRSKAMSMLSLDQFSQLLKFTLQRMKHQGSEPFTQPVNLNTVPIYSDYVFYPMDLSTMERSTRRKVYGCTEAFLTDAKWILHNCIIFNGLHHKLTNSAKMIVKICKHEMAEIEICPDCYLNSCSKKDNKWFSEPCRKPHPLCWAKLKGYPFWPAKALQDKNYQVDVRFFGAHDRAWIPSNQIFMLSSECPTPIRNRKGGFDDAMTELEEHIGRIKDIFGSFEYAPFRTPYDKRHVYKHNKMKALAKKTDVETTASDSQRTSESTNPKNEGDNKLLASSKIDAIKSPISRTISVTAKTASAVKNKYNSIITTRRAATKIGSPKSPKFPSFTINETSGVVKEKIDDVLPLSSTNITTPVDDNVSEISATCKVSDTNIVDKIKEKIAVTSDDTDKSGKEVDSETETETNDKIIVELPDAIKVDSLDGSIIDTSVHDIEDRAEEMETEGGDALDKSGKKNGFFETLRKTIANCKAKLGMHGEENAEEEADEESSHSDDENDDSDEDDDSIGDNKLATESEANKNTLEMDSNIRKEKETSNEVDKSDTSKCQSTKVSGVVLNSSDVVMDDPMDEESKDTSFNDDQKSNLPVPNDGDSDSGSDKLVIDTATTKKHNFNISSQSKSDLAHDKKQIQIPVEDNITDHKESPEKKYNKNNDLLLQKTKSAKVTKRSADSQEFESESEGNVAKRLCHVQTESDPVEVDSKEINNEDYKVSSGHLDMSQYVEKAIDAVRGSFEDMYRDLSHSGQFGTNSLQLEMRKLKWLHKLEIQELQHNADLTFAEIRASLEREKSQAVAKVAADLKSKMEKEKEKAVSETKKKQWCANCGKEAVFYCCWNTSYCDYPCQQTHWPTHMSHCTQNQTQQQQQQVTPQSEQSDISQQQQQQAADMSSSMMPASHHETSIMPTAHTTTPPRIQIQYVRTQGPHVNGPIYQSPISVQSSIPVQALPSSMLGAQQFHNGTGLGPIVHSQTNSSLRPLIRMNQTLQRGTINIQPRPY